MEVYLTSSPNHAWLPLLAWYLYAQVGYILTSQQGTTHHLCLHCDPMQACPSQKPFSNNDIVDCIPTDRSHDLLHRSLFLAIPMPNAGLICDFEERSLGRLTRVYVPLFLIYSLLSSHFVYSACDILQPFHVGKAEFEFHNFAPENQTSHISSRRSFWGLKFIICSLLHIVPQQDHIQKYSYIILSVANSSLRHYTGHPQPKCVQIGCHELTIFMT